MFYAKKKKQKEESFVMREREDYHTTRITRTKSPISRWLHKHPEQRMPQNQILVDYTCHSHSKKAQKEGKKRRLKLHRFKVIHQWKKKKTCLIATILSRVWVTVMLFYSGLVVYLAPHLGITRQVPFWFCSDQRTAKENKTNISHLVLRKELCMIYHDSSPMW